MLGAAGTIGAARIDPIAREVPRVGPIRESAHGEIVLGRATAGRLRGPVGSSQDRRGMGKLGDGHRRRPNRGMNAATTNSKATMKPTVHRKVSTRTYMPRSS